LRIKSSSPKPMTPVDRPDLIDRILENVQVFKEAISEDVARQPSTVVVEILRDVVSSSSKAPSQESQTMASRSKISRAATRSPDERQPIGMMALENAITAAVKNRVPGSEGFGGVFVEKLTPKSRFDANWAIRGIRFGRADRETVNKALANIVVRMRADFKLSDD
jgi:hypothetical protein